MLCKNPYFKGLQACGCGQCLPCRINRRRGWTHRLMLEARGSATAAFVTLTYADSELHIVDEDSWCGNQPAVPDLSPDDAQKFLKRFRKAVKVPIRFFLVGEYGEITGRPHYHLAVFGFPNCIYGRTRPKSPVCCGPCEVVKKTWGKGHAYLGELNEKSASYIAGYVTKKWTKEDSWTKQKLKGRRPEFVRMSLKPGIGAVAIKTLVFSTVERRMGKYLKTSLDAPVALMNGASKLPLGRYLRRVWREALGRSRETPPSVLGRHIEELHLLQTEAKKAAALEGIPPSFRDARSNYFRKNKQKIKTLEARTKIFSNRGVI